jgi:proliferating cell nuclear antigen
MFKAEVKSEVLKELLAVVQTLVDEAKFDLSPDGISIKAVDPAHVAMVEMTLDAGAFEKYEADESELGIDIEKLGDVLKLAKAGEIISMDLEDDKNRLIFHIDNITRRMSLVETAGMSEPKVPNLSLPSTIQLKARELSMGIRASESVSDHITLHASPDAFELVSEGDMDSVNLKLDKDQLELLECKESTKSLFSLDYFSNMIKSIDSDSSVKLNLGTDYPVKLEFDFAEGNGKVTYLLAPRIESD